MTTARERTASEREWLQVREHLRQHRATLSRVASSDYPDTPTASGTTLLTAPRWIPDRPIPLTDIDLTFTPRPAIDPTTTMPRPSGLPRRCDGIEYDSYSSALGEIAAPAVFENRPTYRLLDADLSGPPGRLVFGKGNYFDGIDTGEAAAHEFVARELGQQDAAALRTAIGDPCDLTRRPANLAITTLTVRRERAAGESTFYLHWRDPAKVGHAGGMYQVVPVGVFQPSAEGSANEAADFSLWRNMIREFAEELAGVPEVEGTGVEPVNYDGWPFAQMMDDGLRTGRISVYCLGLGVDPLTYATDLLTMTVIDADMFDALFGADLVSNAEGSLYAVSAADVATLLPSNDARPMQAAGEATLRLALYNSDLYT